MSRQDNESLRPRQAVALRYDGQRAPTVAASGCDAIADEILRIARAHNIPLYENPELAAILSRLDLGDEVPDMLYRIIAEILSFAFYLQGRTPEGFAAPDAGLPTVHGSEPDPEIDNGSRNRQP